MRSAEYLAFHYDAADTLCAIAGLKRPTERHRDDVFAWARGDARPADYPIELGWVFVVPDHRGRGLGRHLCEELLARAPAAGVFATTRPSNTAMIEILRARGFERVGRPFLRRKEELVLFLRSGADAVVPTVPH